MVKSTSGTPQSSVQIYFQQPSNLIKTLFLLISWIVLGLHFELIGPTMIILAHNTHVTYNGIASALASRSGGNLITYISCIIFQRIFKNYSDLILVAAFFLPAIAVFATPFITSIVFMCVLFFVHGLSLGLTVMGSSNLLFKMWGVNAAAPFNMVSLGYGLGAIFANFLVRPFLGSNKLLLNNMTTSSYSNSSFLSPIVVPSNSNIKIPYSITAGLCFLISIGHLIFFMCAQKNRRDKLEMQQKEYTAVNTNPSNNEPDGNQTKCSPYSPATCGRGFFGYGLTLSLIFTIYMFFVGGIDQTFSKFYFSYLKFERFGISTGGAIWGIILYWLSYSVSRLIVAIVCMFIPVYVCLTVAWFGGLILAIVWMIYVWILGLTATSLFVLGSLTGLLLSPMFPLSIGWINQRLNVVPPLLALLMCGSAVGSVILQKISGFVMDRDPNHFPTLLTASVILPIILYMVSNVIIFFHERRLKNKQHPVTNDAPLKPGNFGEEEAQLTNYLQNDKEKL